MTRPTILVTGGTGFIGKNIVEYYWQKSHLHEAKVLSPSHSELDLFSRDSVNKFFRSHDIDYVIHCANVGGSRKARNVTDVVEKNLRMFLNLYDNSSFFDRMIYFGSGAEYDKSKPIKQADEFLDFYAYQPKDSYGFSKYLMSRQHREEDGSDLVCLRLFGVFGQHEDYTFKFISNSIVKYLLGISIHIHQNVVFDWLYVKDLLRILPEFFDMHEYLSPSYNITPGAPMDLVSIAGMINTPKKVEIVVENPRMGNEYTGSNRRLREFRNNISFTPMTQAISELKQYYSENLSRIDPDEIQKDELRNYCKTVT